MSRLRRRPVVYPTLHTAMLWKAENAHLSASPITWLHHTNWLPIVRSPCSFVPLSLHCPTRSFSTSPVACSSSPNLPLQHAQPPSLPIRQGTSSRRANFFKTEFPPFRSLSPARPFSQQGVAQQSGAVDVHADKDSSLNGKFLQFLSTHLFPIASSIPPASSNATSSPPSPLSNPDLLNPELASRIPNTGRYLRERITEYRYVP